MSNDQIPNPNEIPTFNVQFPMERIAAIFEKLLHWTLVIGNWDFIGIWDLEIGISSENVP
jgi:hypothetical protein